MRFGRLITRAAILSALFPYAASGSNISRSMMIKRSEVIVQGKGDFTGDNAHQGKIISEKIEKGMIRKVCTVDLDVCAPDDSLCWSPPYESFAGKFYLIKLENEHFRVIGSDGESQDGE